MRFFRRRLDVATAAELSRLAAAARTDGLTGIGNRRAFEEDLQGILAQHGRDGSTTGPALLDPDGLKAVNDGDGHQAGDRRLRAVAEALRSTARGAQRVYRMGGDEFTAVLPDPSAWQAFDFSGRLHAAPELAGSAVSVGVARQAAAAFVTA